MFKFGDHGIVLDGSLTAKMKAPADLSANTPPDP